ncbi:hypothetical protein THAOC_20416 [Thalassiosira oceanica]|uniref:Uncharacterized protein n=1 Tax=Thalassiosira oceanica TaxID=159749 RepID=K0S2A9_THAOC|nr:hypothetical protein THAOC_20416 [Thalassiosira oceanica]|eukprot:EJK59375.1 hypothetical protein THAOC_20416 [Thalassiosira oceanica]
MIIVTLLPALLLLTSALGSEAFSAARRAGGFSPPLVACRATTAAGGNEIDLHPPTIAALSRAFLVRAEKDPDLLLRFDQSRMEEWEIALNAGKVSQAAVEAFVKEHSLNPTNDSHVEMTQVLGGRIVAVITRFDELEEDLLGRCARRLVELEDEGDDACRNWFVRVGVPDSELEAFTSVDTELGLTDGASPADAFDAECLFCEDLRANRARSLLAMFLKEIEGPGLRRNKVEVPCMDVDFLGDEELEVLFGSKSGEPNEESNAPTPPKQDDVPADSVEPDTVDISAIASPLHPVVLDAVEEGLRLRSKNITTSPLRLIDNSIEMYDVQFTVGKFVERFLSSRDDLNMFTTEEVEVIGGRAVGALMRLEDLEWEWNHRVTSSGSFNDMGVEEYMHEVGLARGLEQTDVGAIDQLLLDDSQFARSRAERLYGVFLMSLEGPGVEASGNVIPHGSFADFIDDELQIELMRPKQRK